MFIFIVVQSAFLLVFLLCLSFVIRFVPSVLHCLRRRRGRGCGCGCGCCSCIIVLFLLVSRFTLMVFFVCLFVGLFLRLFNGLFCCVLLLPH